VTEDRLRRKRLYKTEKKEKWLKTKKQIEDYNKFVQEWKKKQHAKKTKKEEEKPVTTAT